MLQVDQLSGGRGGRLLFADIGFRLDPGAQLLIRGSNGSGKTTLLRILAGLSRGETGTICWQARTQADGLRDLCCYAGHTPALHGDLTIAENIAFWAAIEPAASTPERAIERVGLRAARNLEVRRLSAGQRRRAAFARVLLSLAPVWLLDEPLSNLDAEGRAVVQAAIREHRDAGGMVIVATHDVTAGPDPQTSELRIGSRGEASQ